MRFSRFSLVRSMGIIVLAALSPGPAAAEIKHVLHITVDGLRGDLLEGMLVASPADYPNFRRLRDEGAGTFNARCDFHFSETLPNHCSVVTGRPVNNPVGTVGVGHLYTINGYSAGGGNIHKYGSAAYQYKPGVFDTVHDRGLSTAVYAGKTRLLVVVDSYNAANGRADTLGADNGKQKIDFTSVADLSTPAELARVKNAVIADITALPASKLRTYSLVHFTDTDTGAAGGGHFAGWGSAAWKLAARDVDRYLGEIFAALAAETTDPAIKGKVAIVLTSDHGGGGGSTTSHTDAAHAANYTIPTFLWGPGIPAGADLYALFKNRVNPAAGRPVISLTAPQPLRNADTANIAMALLGLPVIENSFFQPEFAATPTISKEAGNYVVRWPAYLTDYRLESTTDPAAGPWIADTGTPVEDPVTMTMSRSFPESPSEPRRFLRLRGPQ